MSAIFASLVEAQLAQDLDGDRKTALARLLRELAEGVEAGSVTNIHVDFDFDPMKEEE